MTPWTDARRARWTRRYLAVDSGKYAGRVLRKPRAQWWAFRGALALAWWFRWPWLSELALYFCQPRWVGMGGYSWEWRWWWRNEKPF